MKKLLLKSMLLLCALIVGNSSVWATDQTLTLTQSALSLTGSYTTNTEKTVGGITFVYTDLMKNNDDIQAKASSGVIYNKTAFPTKILSVAITHNGTARATTIFGSANGTDWTQVQTGSGSITGDFSSNNYKYFKITRGSNAAYWQKVVITYEEAAAEGTTEAPEISGNTPFYGSTTATITNAASADGADIYYTLDGSDPTTTTSATCFEYTAAFSIDATTTVKAIAKKSTDTNASSVVSKTFTKVTPLTVAQALTAIDALADGGTIAEQSVRGVITEVTSYNSNTITYIISDDVTGSNQLKVYKGKGLHNANFSAKADLKLGDDVVVYGTLKKFGTSPNITPEFDQNNYLLFKESKAVPTFTLSPSSKTLTMGNEETVDVTLTTNTDGLVTCKSSNNDVATVALKSAGFYTITAVAAGNATITIESALSNNYQPASATVSITVADNREAAGLAFANTSVTKTWGESFTGQELTNPHSLDVTWSSTNEAVATVNSSGVVSVLKAGTTAIKASFDGDATYKKQIASYTLTINKASAGLSYAVTAFDIMLNDDSFVAPTLINPNGLTVTYASSNTNVAVVDENTGELVYDETAAGTATITATFAGNDNYKTGSANYTINIIDPTVKGTKYNPYTVAEVINGTATGSGIYVTGFIVGEFKSGDDPITSGFTTDANIAMADVFTASPSKNSSIPVQLNTDALKTAWGNKTNSGKTMGYKITVKGNKDTYFGVNGIKGVNEVIAVSVPITPGYANITYVTPYKMNFASVNGLKAYVATSANGSGVTMTRVEDAVPEDTPLLLVATAGTKYDVPVAASATTPETNFLRKGDGTTVFDGTTYDYILYSDGKFYQIGSGTVATNKAYLHLDSAPARALDIVFDDETTGIKENNRETIANNQFFDLSGRKVAQPTKGLYIVNGKKVIIK